MLDLKRAKEICDAATPGPWYLDLRENDVAFVHFARTALPELIDECEKRWQDFLNMQERAIAAEEEIECLDKRIASFEVEVHRLRKQLAERDEEIERLRRRIDLGKQSERDYYVWSEKEIESLRKRLDLKPDEVGG